MSQEHEDFTKLSDSFFKKIDDGVIQQKYVN